MLGNLRQGCWYGRISLHAICKHANSIACDRHWIAFRDLGDFQNWERMRGRWEICLAKQCLLLRNIRFVNFNRNVKNAERDWTFDKPSLSESNPYPFLRFGCTLLLMAIKKYDFLSWKSSVEFVWYQGCAVRSSSGVVIHKQYFLNNCTEERIAFICEEKGGGQKAVHEEQNSGIEEFQDLFIQMEEDLRLPWGTSRESPSVWRTGLPWNNS